MFIVRVVSLYPIQVTLNRRDGVVAKASASQLVNLGFIISQVESYQKTLKNGIYCLALSTKGTVWRASRQARLLCSRARHLRGCLHLCSKHVARPSSLPVAVTQSG